MESNCDACLAKGQDEISVELLNDDLWKKFHQRGNEMIVTKSGRRMFPFLRIKVSSLDPTAYYCILVEFNLTTNHRFKYYANTGWTPAGTDEAHSNQRVYIHPESPATGEHWMSQSISFGRLKLTNSTGPGLIVLSSQHKYQPRILIVKSLDPRALTWAPTTTVSFPETQFLSVTAYQNEEITKLKIEHNPFAKGFRQTGQAKTKRKRADVEDGDNENQVLLVHSPASSSSPSLDNTDHCVQSHLPQMPFMYPFLPYTYPVSPYYFYYNQNYALPQTQPERIVAPKSEIPKKLTDFSIRAITGL